MWLVAVSVPLLPAVLLASTVYSVQLAALWRRLLAWLRRLAPREVCVRSTHAYIFSNCTHGKVVSVLETFDLYNLTHPHFCVSPPAGQYRVRPVWVVVVGVWCWCVCVALEETLVTPVPVIPSQPQLWMQQCGEPAPPWCWSWAPTALTAPSACCVCCPLLANSSQWSRTRSQQTWARKSSWCLVSSTTR